MKQDAYYRALLRYAHRVAFHAHEAEDLLQTVLLSAIENGRTDMSCVKNRRWLLGALRNQSAFWARTAVRRHQREASVAYTNAHCSDCNVSTTRFVNTLTSTLKTTALLALTGHTKAEMTWLMGISDATLRQRIVQIKKRWRQFDGSHVLETKGLKAGLAFGRIRQALLNMPRKDAFTLASHDPDGHLFMLNSQNAKPRQHRVKLIEKEE